MALTYFSKFGKVQKINQRRTGRNRPCEYRMHDSFTEKQEPRNMQEKGRCRVRCNPHSIESKPTIYKPTKEKKPQSPVKSKDKIHNLRKTFKKIQGQTLLTQKQKKTAAFLIRFERKKSLVSGLVDSLWRRNCVAGIWQDVLAGLDDLDVVAGDEELLWRSRKAIKALVQGATVETFRAIMLDQPLNEQEGVERDMSQFDRRLSGLEKWRDGHNGDEFCGWYVEIREALYKQQRQARRELASLNGRGLSRLLESIEGVPMTAVLKEV